MNINKTIHEARGRCYHNYGESGSFRNCLKCGVSEVFIKPNPDYEHDLNLLFEAAGEILDRFLTDINFTHNNRCGTWFCSITHYRTENKYKGDGKTPSEAMANALVAYIGREKWNEKLKYL